MSVRITDNQIRVALASYIIDGNVVQATTTTQGKVELATSAETITGTDTERATTPAGVKAVADLKVDLTSNPVIPATTGTVTIPFSSNADYQPAVQTGNITLAASGSVACTRKVIIDGDSSHTLSFPAAWKNRNGGVFSNTARNSITIYRDANGIFEYSVFNDTIPDIISPTLSSAATNSAGTTITLTYNESLDTASTPATTDFTLNLSKTVTNVQVTGSTVVLTVSSAYTNGQTITLSYTPGSNPIQDTTGNDAASLTNQSVTNGVSFTSSKSYSQPTQNQVAKSATNPSTLAFGSGGTDLPFSLMGYIKMVTTPSGSQVVAALSFSTSSQYQYELSIGNTSLLGMVLYSNGTTAAYIGKNSSALTANTWYHFAITYSGNKALSGIKIYLNGALATTTNLSAGSYAGMLASNANTQFSIGGYLGSSNAANLRMDNMKVVNKELSIAEVQEDYNSGTLMNPTLLTYYSNIVEAWEFEDTINGTRGTYNLSATTTPTYSTDHP